MNSTLKCTECNTTDTFVDVHPLFMAMKALTRCRVCGVYHNPDNWVEVKGITDAARDSELVRCVITGARGSKYPRERYAIIRGLFPGISVARATELCRRFNLDPDEVVAPAEADASVNDVYVGHDTLWFVRHRGVGCDVTMAEERAELEFYLARALFPARCPCSNCHLPLEDQDLELVHVGSGVAVTYAELVEQWKQEKPAGWPTY